MLDPIAVVMEVASIFKGSPLGSVVGLQLTIFGK